MTFADQLLDHRSRLGLTQAKAAALLGVGLSTYRAWETGDPDRTPLDVTREGVIARLRDAARARKRVRNAAP
jgi:DNA-binding XRE family transcriptional regulator